MYKRQALDASKGNARSLSLDIYDQWETMNKDGKWRFTSPTHTVLAFSKALDELEERGGVEARYQRYASNNKLLIEKMAALGINAYIDEAYRSPIITTFLYPEQGFDFTDMYNFCLLYTSCHALNNPSRSKAPEHRDKQIEPPWKLKG